jgi:cytochrome c553
MTNGSAKLFDDYGHAFIPIKPWFPESAAIRVTALIAAAAGLCLALLPLEPTRALPSFARQTGQECAACHNGIAAYCSAQPAAPPESADPALRRRGAELFAKGIEDRGVPACASCHGDAALGQGAFPRLADQHAGYITEQLRNFRDNARANETMHQTALPLADDEIAALAAYLSSL